jgi:hypothetical protein
MTEYTLSGIVPLYPFGVQLYKVLRRIYIRRAASVLEPLLPEIGVSVCFNYCPTEVSPVLAPVPPFLGVLVVGGESRCCTD